MVNKIPIFKYYNFGLVLVLIYVNNKIVVEKKDFKTPEIPWKIKKNLEIQDFIKT